MNPLDQIQPQDVQPIADAIEKAMDKFGDKLIEALREELAKFRKLHVTIGE